MKLKIYEPVYEAAELDCEELTEADYELVFDRELSLVDLADLFRSFTGRDAPYGYLGRTMGRGHVVCISGGVHHGKYICESDGEPYFSRIEFDERLAYDWREGLK